MNNRLLHIDIYRAICIIVVIYSHLLLFSVGYKEEAFITIFMRAFFLNAFFFISGYVFYQNIYIDFNQFYMSIYKKIKSILLPSLISLCVFSHIYSFNFIKTLFSDNKGGYWFTFVLFEMFVLFLFINLLINRVKNRIIRLFIIIAITSILYYFNKINILSSIYKDFFSLGGLMYYVPAFALGVICKLYDDIFNKVLNNKNILFISGIIILLIFTNMSIIPFIIRNIITTLFVLQLIYHILNSIDLSRYKILISNLSLIGTNTVQIYFLHYYFLFRLPEPLISYMHSLHSDSCFASTSCASFVEFIVIGTLSIFISFVCIYVAKIINVIPYANMLLFGKYKKTGYKI